MTNMIDVNAPALQARVTNILKDPKREWPVIAAEPTTTEKLYSSYIAPLAAIPAIATFIGYSIVGLSLPFVGTVRVGIIRGLVSAFVSYVVSLVLVYVAAMVIDWLAPKFESTPNQIQALKLVAYSYTAAWVAGVVMVIPALAMLGVLGGLYSIYLFYVGLPVMMKTPESKVVPYMAVSAVSVIVMGIILAMITAAVTGMPGTVYS
ncbi:MAG: YIP1 family protein [Acidobacteriota bacterium]|nr:YIP1 family protein [Acidobacteriota bacterium]